MAEPSISVVVAAWEDPAGLAECLESLAGQRPDAAEVIVVSSAPATDALRARFHGVAWMDAAREEPIPRLWALGLERARRDVVALTTAHFTPASDWIATIGRSHARLPSPAIGGSIEPPMRGGPVDWATYFLRYSAYPPGGREESRPDLAADNASYKRADVLAEADLLREGFWEQAFHQRWTGAGRTLTFVPEIRVRQAASFGFRRFLRQRFRHGRQFGRTRLRGHRPWKGALYAAASPLVPAILLAKVGMRVARQGTHLGPFVKALPVLLCFIVAWAAGEATGYVAAARERDAA